MKKVIINYYSFNSITSEISHEQFLCQERDYSYKTIDNPNRKVFWKKHLDKLVGNTFISTYSLGDVNQFKRSIAYELKYRIDLCERQIKSNQSEIEKYKQYIEQIEREV